MGWMDKLFGTDCSFKSTINETRHQNLFTLKAAQEKFPGNVEISEKDR